MKIFQQKMLPPNQVLPPPPPLKNISKRSSVTERDPDTVDILTAGLTKSPQEAEEVMVAFTECKE